MQVIVVSNASSKRTDYLMDAGKRLHVEVRFMTYKELYDCLPQLRQAVIKLEPCVSSETNFLKYASVTESYRQLLGCLDTLTLPVGVSFLNTPCALLHALDKKRAKQTLIDNGLSVTPMLSEPTSFEELRQRLTDCRRGCFLKPRYGSGAGGIMAFRYHPRGERWVAYTTLAQTGNGIHNTKRTNCLRTEREIVPLAEAVIHMGAVLEEWIPKEELDGESYDLRVVCRAEAVDYVVVRCGKGCISNLHLNNRSRLVSELELPDLLWQQIGDQCRRAVRSLGLRYAGVDVLIERGTGRPFLIEVNGQGDHIYRDMYADNSIYMQQINDILNLSQSEQNKERT